MKLRTLIVASLLWTAACGDPEPKAYTTYQLCFDDQTMVSKLMVPDAIVACCIDHPIASVKPSCGATKPDCINYLTANLSQTSASTTEVMDSCTEYVAQMKTPPAS